MKNTEAAPTTNHTHELCTETHRKGPFVDPHCVECGEKMEADQAIIVDREQGFIFDPETGRLVFIS